MIQKLYNTQLTNSIFGDWQETLIFSCLQQVMGEIYVDSQEQPTCAMALIGDFCFLAGSPNEELACFKPKNCEKDFIIMVPQNDKWAELIKDVYGERATKVVRYAIQKEPDVFDLDKLEAIAQTLAEEYTISLIDERYFHMCKMEHWSCDLVSQYKDYQMYQELGIGVVICKDDIPVSGASAYTRYLEGIEIEIDTRDDYRRKGLASVCGAKLILECLKRGLYPSWDAQNLWSVALSEKLGYHFDHEYPAFEINGY
jgi:GNAT superfamily N-acetyltransferase